MELKRERWEMGWGAGRVPPTKKRAFSKLRPSEGLKKNPPGPPS